MNKLELELCGDYFERMKTRIKAKTAQIIKRELIASHLLDYVDSHFDKWVENAFTAKFQLELNEQYKIGEKDGEKYIIPVDNQNTGVSM